MPEITTTHQQYVQVVCMLVEAYWFYLATKTLKENIKQLYKPCVCGVKSKYAYK